MNRLLGTGVLGLSMLVALSGCGRAQQTDTTANVPMASARQDAFHHGHGHYGGGGWWGWGGWGGRAVTAWGDHLQFIGQARYLTAKANHENALALQEYARANAYARLMHSMKIDLWRLEREKYKMAQARKALEDKARSLNGIVLGKLTFASPALLYFTSLPGFNSLKVVTDNESVGPFAPEQFVASKTKITYKDGVKKVEEVTIDGFNGGSVSEFFGWIASKGYSVKVDTAVAGAPATPWQLLMQVRAQLQEQIALTDDAIKEEMKKDTADTIQIWGESIWGNYGDGLLKDYTKDVAAADAAK